MIFFNIPFLVSVVAVALALLFGAIDGKKPVSILKPASIRLALTRGTPECLRHPTRMWHNGTCNNGEKMKQGSAHEPFKLLFTPSTRDPASIDLPSARLVSNKICHEEKTVLNRRGITEFWTYFGQIVDHTIAETHLGKVSMNIPIPANDYFFPRGGDLPFLRTVKKQTLLGESPENILSSYLDASCVYGVPSSLVDKLRLKLHGKLKVTPDGLLPKTRKPGKHQFQAGDARANENPALQAIHTLFVLEHNRVCEELAEHFPYWKDNEMYENARLIVTAEFQAIVYYEFLPAILGQPMPKYTGYKKWIDASISNEFATSIYRVGHTLINPVFTLYGKDGKTYTKQLRDTFFKTDLLLAEGIDGVLRGTMNTRAAEVDVKITSQVRNFLTLDTPMKVDLASLNIQRGRDHAVPGYNALRRLYGLTGYKRFSQISKNRLLTKRLQEVYAGDIEKIDPWIGGLAEDHQSPGSLGPLFTKAWVAEFTRMRDGNRFYFENTDYFSREIGHKSNTVHKILKEIGVGGTMRRILLANTKLEKEHVPANPFRMHLK